MLIDLHCPVEPRGYEITIDKKKNLTSCALMLILTYNLSLRNYIHDKINDVREDFYWENFVILNYHDFINSTINNLGIEFKAPEGFDSWSDSEVESYLDKNYYGNIGIFNGYQDYIQRYLTILIDEVQDYKNNWLRIIKRYFLDKNGEFVVFGDSKQDIYNRVSFVNKKKDIVIPDSPGRWAELKKSFRFTPIITKFVIAYQSAFFVDKHNLDDFDQENETLEFEGGIYYKTFNDIDYEEIAKFISSFSEKLDVHRNDVCVLTLSVDILREIDYHYRKITREKTYMMSETKEYFEHNPGYSRDIRRNKKLHFWMNSGLTKFSTVHSFKGWEINTLYLIVIKNYFKATHKELIYTGFTRCMENLVIINIDDDDLSNFISTLSYVKRFN